MQDSQPTPKIGTGAEETQGIQRLTDNTRRGYLVCQATPLPAAVRFFWQRWREALDPSSPVSVKARTTGPRALLDEFREVQSLNERGFGSGDLIALREEGFGHKTAGVEIAGVMSGDGILNQLHPDMLEKWAVLEKSLAGSHGEEAKASRRAALLAQVRHSVGSGYREAVSTRLTDLLFSGDQFDDRLANQVDELVGSLITDLLGTGFSDAFLRTRGADIEREMLNVPAHAQEAFSSFIARLAAPSESTVVLIKAKASKKFWAAWPRLTDVLAADTREGVIPGTFEIREGSRAKVGFEDNQDGNSRFLRFKPNANDRSHASRLAYQEFEHISDGVCFANPGVHPARIEAVATVRQGAPEVLEVVRPRDAEFFYQPLRSSLADVEAGKSGFSAACLNGSDPAARRLTGALRALRIAHEETWLESGLTTLWTAIETLAHEHYAGNIIDSVVRSVVPFVAGAKIQNLVDDLIVYLDWAGVTESQEFADDFADTVVGAVVSPVRIVHALSEEPRAIRLAEIARESPLVAYRVNRFHIVARSPMAAARRATQTAMRIEWQLRRIYRLRNAIIHGGEFTGAGEQMLQHLDGYVRAVIGPLSMILAANNGIDTIDEAVAAVDTSFDAWRAWAMLQRDRPTENDAARMYQPSFASLSGAL